MSYKIWFLTDKFFVREVKKNCQLPTSEKSKAFGKHRPPALAFLFMNILINNLFMQFFYIQNRNMCLSKKILYHYFVDFFALLGTTFPLETFNMSLHNMKNLKKIQAISDSLKQECKIIYIRLFNSQSLLCCRFSFEAYAKSARE